MKRMILFLLICSVFINGNAQVKFGAFAGPQGSSSHYTINGLTQHNDMKYGFQAGIEWKVPFENKLYFSPMVFYSMKGYKVHFNQYAFPPDVNATDNNTTIHCIETAALLQYDFSSRSNHFFFRAGPSLDFQLFGHEKYNLMNGTAINKSMTFDFSNYGHFSANALAHLGYETKGGIMIFAQYTFGLTSINNADGGPSIRHRAYGISVGKFFK